MIALIEENASPGACMITIESPGSPGGTFQVPSSARSFGSPGVPIRIPPMGATTLSGAPPTHVGLEMLLLLWTEVPPEAAYSPGTDESRTKRPALFAPSRNWFSLGIWISERSIWISLLPNSYASVS